MMWNHSPLLPSCPNNQYLQYFDDHRQEAFCFDLDVDAECLTIVAYRAFQRFSTITLFYWYQQHSYNTRQKPTT